MSVKQRRRGRRASDETAPKAGGAGPKKPAAAPARVRPNAPKHRMPPAALRARHTLRVCRVLVGLAAVAGGLACAAIGLNLVEGLLAVAAVGPAIGLLGVAAVLQARNEHQATGLGEAYRRADELAELNSSVIASFAMAIDAKDQHTHGHTERVRDIAAMMCEEMGLSSDDTQALKTAAMLHDIGKLAVPDYVLSKTEPLTREERKKIESHTLVGAAILEPVKFPWPVVPIIRSHHEWYDGTGYPDKLAGDQIPLGARILGVADMYDALLSHRPYRAAMTVQEAVALMREHSGTQFDPEILNVCFKVLSSQRAQNRLGFIFNADGTGIPPEAMDASGQRAIFMNIRQAHQELLALYEVVQTMGQSLNMQETADLIISKSKRIIDFATCVLFLVQPDDSQLVAVAASGPYSEIISGRHIPLGSGVSGAVALKGVPSGVDCAASDDLVFLLGPAAKDCNLTEVLSSPLVCDTGTIGTLTVYRASNRPFTEDEARLAATVSRQATIAINNAQQYEQTKQSALTDSLTGLANARYFFVTLEQELTHARQEHRTISLISIDLDNLKQVNDNYGHQQGDRVLRLLADIFRQHVRDTDTVVRYAGDEFFIILPDTSNKAAVETANRIKRAVHETPIEMRPGRVIGLGASFGVATFPGDAEDTQALIAVADRAMYADKRLSHQALLLSSTESEDKESKGSVSSRGASKS